MSNKLLTVFNGATAAFTPASISGLQIWLKRGTGLYQETTGASATTAASAAADPIGTWLDQSGNGNHPIAPADSQRLTYRASQYGTKPGAQGDGTDDYLSKTSVSFGSLGSGNYTIWFIAKAGSSTRILFYLVSGGGQLFCFQNVAGKQRFNHKDNASTEIAGGSWDVTAPTSAYYYGVIIRNGTSFTQRIDGVVPTGGTQTATLSTTTTNNLYLMSNQGINGFNDGHLVELGIHNSALSGADLTNLETYLANTAL